MAPSIKVYFLVNGNRKDLLYFTKPVILNYQVLSKFALFFSPKKLTWHLKVGFQIWKWSACLLHNLFLLLPLSYASAQWLKIFKVWQGILGSGLTNVAGDGVAQITKLPETPCTIQGEATVRPCLLGLVSDQTHSVCLDQAQSNIHYHRSNSFMFWKQKL